MSASTSAWTAADLEGRHLELVMQRDEQGCALSVYHMQDAHGVTLYRLFDPDTSGTRCHVEIDDGGGRTIRADYATIEDLAKVLNLHGVRKS